MADTLKVTAVEGRMLPIEGAAGGRFVGYSLVRADDEETRVDHEIPVSKDALGPDAGRRRFARSEETVEVPNTRYYREAVRRGDIDLADEER